MDEIYGYVRQDLDRNSTFEEVDRLTLSERLDAFFDEETAMVFLVTKIKPRESA